MDERLKSILSDLRKKSSNEAANWLMERYPLGSPNSGEPITILSHLSWKKADQVRLAEYYLSNMPFANAWAYKAFARIMSVHRLVEIMKKHIPSDDRKKLLEYHVATVLASAARSQGDREAVQSFLTELKAR
jgi:hypothetical protein